MSLHISNTPRHTTLLEDLWTDQTLGPVFLPAMKPRASQAMVVLLARVLCCLFRGFDAELVWN